jgi:exosortase/archaeosortase family protein
MISSWKRLLAFLVLYGALYFLLAQTWGKGLSRWIIDVATVRPAAWFARLVFNDPSIVADGSHLRSGDVALNVLFGCEGTDVLLVLMAALLVTPVRWSDRFAGLLGGTAFVFVVNQLRLFALFLALKSQREWFGALHGLILPLLVVAMVTAFYLMWLRWTQRSGAAHVPAF